QSYPLILPSLRVAAGLPLHSGSTATVILRDALPANAKALTEAIGARGERILTLPRGFYLKKNFTSAL
ncbi:hypothetical protein ACSLO9_34710, partial [Escherichia coli]